VYSNQLGEWQQSLRRRATRRLTEGVTYEHGSARIASVAALLVAEAWRHEAAAHRASGCISLSLVVTTTHCFAIALALGLCAMTRVAAPPPDLPGWAYPEGDVLGRHYSCGGQLDRPPCQTITIGSNSTMAEVANALQPEFALRGWQFGTGASSGTSQLGRAQRCLHWLRRNPTGTD